MTKTRFRRLTGIGLSIGLICCVAVSAALSETPVEPAAPAAVPVAAQTVAAPNVPDEAAAVAGPPAAAEARPGTEVLEPDLADLPVSNAARVRLDRARDSVVQIRGFFGDAQTSAFHGSGFAVNEDGAIVTNYHVVSDAVLHPRQYRLEYVTADNRTGRLQVYAVDVRNDLAIVKGDGLKLPPLRLRTQVPSQGARAYSIGFPLNLGLTITEGVANGLVDTGFDQRIHYTGAINGGMSGGPALDAGGGVYGVNVSVIAARQLVGFVVPARHIEPLLARAQAPLASTLSPQQARGMVTVQALVHEASVLDLGPQPVATQTVFGFTLPTRMAPAIECNTTGASESSRRLRMEAITCAARAGLLVQRDLEVGSIRYQHLIVRAQDLQPLQFAQRLNAMSESYGRTGSSLNVAPFACKNALVSLDGFEARVTTCARQYRLFSGLYDIAVTVTSINSTQSAVVSQLDLGGVGFEPGMQFVRRYLEAMRWMP
jgi:S1-C subfamily serine protease